MLNRVKAVEDRSKQLAKLLEGAVSELWDYQRLVAESTRDSHDTKGPNDLERLSVAIAKVQFVQVYLDDPGLPIPESPNTQDTDQEAGTEDYAPIKDEITHDESPEAPTKTITRTHGQDLAEEGPQMSGAAVPQKPDSSENIEDLADPSTFEDTPEQLPPLQNHVPKVVIQTEANKSVPNTTASPEWSDKPGLSATRPRLEQSSFSWMLGDQEIAPQRTPSSSSLLEQTSGRGFLFGDGEGKPDKANQATRRGEGKSGARTRDADGQEYGKTFDLSTLRHGKGKNG